MKYPIPIIHTVSDVNPTRARPITFPAMSWNGVIDESSTSITRFDFSSMVLENRVWLVPMIPMNMR